jgi:hypothetical protein
VSTSLHGLARFWWLVVAGLVVGALVAVVVYREEAKPKYTATANLFVDSPSAPYLRTSQTQESTRQGTGRVQRRNGHLVRSAPVSSSSSVTSSPDTQTLVNAANTYPLLIQSDKIKQLRESKYGVIPGTVTANALNATTNSYGVFRPSPLPVIEVKAKSDTRSRAEQLADATVGAFQVWMRQEQKAHQIPASQRISVQQLESPVVTTDGGRSKGLPLFIGVLILLAFCAIAIVIDNNRPEPAPDSARSDAPAGAQHSLEG